MKTLTQWGSGGRTQLKIVEIYERPVKLRQHPFNSHRKLKEWIKILLRSDIMGQGRKGREEGAGGRERNWGQWWWETYTGRGMGVETL